MSILTKAQILAADDLAKEVVAVAEWGGDVIVRTLTAAARDAFEASMVTRDAAGKLVSDTNNMRAKLVALSLVDEGGALLFTVNEVEALAAKSAAPMKRLFDVAERLSGLAPAAVEEAAKNSEAVPSGGVSSS